MNKNNIQNLAIALQKGGFETNNSMNPLNYAELLNSEWGNLLDSRLKKEKIVKSQDLVYIQSKKMHLTNENYFDLASEYAPEFKHLNDNELSTLFSKTRASFNVANNYILSVEKNAFDLPTKLGYFGLTKIFYVYRFLENFVDYLNLLTNEKPRESNSVGKYNSTGLFLAFVEKLNLNNSLKELYIQINCEKNSKQESIFSYIDSKQQKEREAKGNNFSYVKDNVLSNNIESMALINDLRHLFVHSKISASSGSGNPLIMFILTSTLADIVLKEANLFFKNEVLNKKFDYKL